MPTRIIFLIIGLLINALGNGLTIAADCGSAVWTAAAVGLSNTLNLSVAIIIFVLGVVNAITNQILLWKIDVIRFIEEIAYVAFFSYFIDIFTKMFVHLNVGGHGYIISAILSIIGITCIGISISLYQRANVFMHPNDDTSNILRFKFFKGSAPLSQFIDMLPPVIIIIVTFFINGHLDAVNIGTIYFFLFNGVVIKYADRLIAPKLVHNFKKNEDF